MTAHWTPPAVAHSTTAVSFGLPLEQGGTLSTPMTTA